MNDLSNSATKRLIDAIYHKNIEGVREALLDGASVNAKSGDWTKEPIWYEQILLNDRDKESAPIYAKIWEQLIPSAMDVAAPDEFSRCRGLSAGILTLNNFEAASTVALAAIKETKGSVEINLPEIFAGIGEPGQPYDPARKEDKDKIMRVHARIRERLSNPQTDFERDVAAALSEHGKGYWLQPLNFPDLCELPMPSQQFVDAVEQMHSTLSDAFQQEQIHSAISEAFQRATKPGFVERLSFNVPRNIRDATEYALNESREVSEEIKRHKQEGRLGVRFPKPRGDKDAGNGKG